MSSHLVTAPRTRLAHLFDARGAALYLDPSQIVAVSAVYDASQDPMGYTRNYRSVMLASGHTLLVADGPDLMELVLGR